MSEKLLDSIHKTIFSRLDTGHLVALVSLYMSMYIIILTSKIKGILQGISELLLHHPRTAVTMYYFLFVHQTLANKQYCTCSIPIFNLHKGGEILHWLLKLLTGIYGILVSKRLDNIFPSNMLCATTFLRSSKFLRWWPDMHVILRQTKYTSSVFSALFLKNYIQIDKT